MEDVDKTLVQQFACSKSNPLFNHVYRKAQHLQISKTLGTQARRGSSKRPAFRPFYAEHGLIGSRLQLNSSTGFGSSSFCSRGVETSRAMSTSAASRAALRGHWTAHSSSLSACAWKNDPIEAPNSENGEHLPSFVDSIMLQSKLLLRIARKRRR